VGQLRTLPIDNLFRSTDQPHLLTDFALLDAAGQLVGYWPLESVQTGYVMFPIRLDDFAHLRTLLPQGTRLSVRCRCGMYTRNICGRTLT
jgi:hypothetical protein